MLKPRPGGFDDAYRANLLCKIRALGGLEGAENDQPRADVKEPRREIRPEICRKQPQVIAFGASTGGIHAFNIILRGLPANFRLDRKSVVQGKSVSVRVDLGGRRIIKKKKHKIVR